jgi:hypothetical protein
MTVGGNHRQPRCQWMVGVKEMLTSSCSREIHYNPVELTRDLTGVWGTVITQIRNVALIPDYWRRVEMAERHRSFKFRVSRSSRISHSPTSHKNNLKSLRHAIEMGKIENIGRFLEMEWTLQGPLFNMSCSELSWGTFRLFSGQIFVCLFGGTGLWTQGLVLAKHVFFHLSHFCFGYFWGRVSHLCPLWPGLWSSYLYFLHSWDDRCISPCLALYWLRWES